MAIFFFFHICLLDQFCYVIILNCINLIKKILSSLFTVKREKKTYLGQEKHISKEEGKDEELIQSSITTDPGNHMGK